MMTDRNVIINLAIEHLEGEGEWLLCAADGCRVGEDE